MSERSGKHHVACSEQRARQGFSRDREQVVTSHARAHSRCDLTCRRRDDIPHSKRPAQLLVRVCERRIELNCAAVAASYLGGASTATARCDAAAAAAGGGGVCATLIPHEIAEVVVCLCGRGRVGFDGSAVGGLGALLRGVRICECE